MSQTIRTYAVPVQLMKRVISARSQGLYDAVVTCSPQFIAGIDALDPDSQFTCSQAIAALVNGDVSREIPGHLYGYALEAICYYVGVRLNPIEHVHGAAEWIKQVDNIMEKKKLPVFLSALVYSGSPVVLPNQETYPYIGKWLPREIKPAVEAFAAIPVNTIEPGVARVFGQMFEWLRLASTKPDNSIIGFLS
jgi:hypothetical protein